MIYIILIVFVSIAILFQNCPICEKKYFVKCNTIFAHYSPLLKKCLHCGASLNIEDHWKEEKLRIKDLKE